MSVTRHAFRGARALHTAASASREAWTPLARSLARRVRFAGPVPVAEYMRECLTHPAHGYYTGVAEVLGRKGDFVTAPEVSQVFGELVGVWAGSVVQSFKGAEWRLVECGGGTGRLMADVTRVLKRLGCAPVSVGMVEASSVMAEKQRATLDGRGVPVRWFASVDDALEEGKEPVVFVAQEFFDALPVHVFQRAPGGVWRERLVDVQGDADPGPFHFRFVLAPGATPASAMLDSFVQEVGGETGRDSGDVIELSIEAMAVIEKMARCIAQRGGAALLVDYGADSGFTSAGNTLRAIRRHEITPVLSSPGACDVTVDVNFAHLRAAVERLSTPTFPVGFHGAVSQRHFLLSLGAAERFRALARSVLEKSDLSDTDMDAALAKLQSDYQRLVAPDAMGELYKVAAICHEEIGKPAGF